MTATLCPSCQHAPPDHEPGCHALRPGPVPEWVRTDWKSAPVEMEGGTLFFSHGPGPKAHIPDMPVGDPYGLTLSPSKDATP